jgi:HEAT repeat protein
MTRLRDERALPPLLALRRDDDPHARRFAIRCLAKLPDAPSEAFLDGLGELHAGVRLAAIEAIGKVRRPEMLEPLIDALLSDRDRLLEALCAVSAFGGDAIRLLVAVRP